MPQLYVSGEQIEEDYNLMTMVKKRNMVAC